QLAALRWQQLGAGPAPGRAEPATGLWCGSGQWLYAATAATTTIREQRSRRDADCRAAAHTAAEQLPAGTAANTRLPCGRGGNRCATSAEEAFAYALDCWLRR